MKPGTYCTPFNEQEWRAILDLAESLGLSARVQGSFKAHPILLYADVFFGESTCGTISGTLVMPAQSKSIGVMEVPTSTFISGMYEMAGKKRGPFEADTKEEDGRFFAFVGGKWVDVTKEALPQLNAHEGRIKVLENHKVACIGDHQETDSRIKGLEVVQITLDDRLSKLEAALNDHLVRCRDRDLRERSRDIQEAMRMAEATRLDDHLVKERKAEVAEVEKLLKPIISQEEVNEQIDRVLRIKSVSKGEDHDIRIDPKASPKDIPFSVALEYLKVGRKVRRSSWGSESYAKQDGVPGPGSGGIRMFHDGLRAVIYMNPDQSDLYANDWEVLPEPSK